MSWPEITAASVGQAYLLRDFDRHEGRSEGADGGAGDCRRDEDGLHAWVSPAIQSHFHVLQMAAPSRRQLEGNGRKDSAWRCGRASKTPKLRLRRKPVVSNGGTTPL